MKPSITIGHRLLWVLLLAMGLSGCNLATPLHDRVETVTATHVAATPLRVETTNGSIAVTKSDRDDVQIVARIRAASKERAEATHIVAQRGGDQALAVRVEWPDGRPLDREACSFEIEIPDAVGVALVTLNGELQCSDLVGPADLETTNGGIQVERHAGPIDARTTNGTVAVSGATESVQAETTNGTISIALAPESAGPVNAHVLNGMIDLAVGPAFAGKLLLQTGNGAVDVDKSIGAKVLSSGPREAHLAFGDSVQESTIATLNGMVRVSKVAGDPSHPTDDSN